MNLLTRFYNDESKPQMWLTLRNNGVSLPVFTKETDIISEEGMPFVDYVSTGSINKMIRNHV